MKTKNYFGITFAAILGGFIAVFAYSTWFSKQKVVYVNDPNLVKLVSFADTNPGQIDFTFAAEQTVHAVVHVRTKSIQQAEFNNPILDFLYGDYYSKPVVGFGSGVIISPNGFLVTNHHVIKGAAEISVKLNDNREFEAKLVGEDPSTDLALLKIEGENLPYVPYGNSEELRLGEWVLAVGNPFNLTSTVTAGIVSAKGRNLNMLNDQYKIESFIQTDAALNPGNSGGALVNTKGQLVGINTAILSPNGSYAGNSFAVPVTIVKKVVDDLREFGSVQRAVLNISIKDVNDEMAKQYNLPKISGIYITEIREGAAKEAGAKAGDIIIKINNIEVSNTSEMQEQLSKYRPNDKIALTLIRDNNEINLTATLRNLKGDTKLVKNNDGYVIMGAKFTEVPPDEKQRLGLRYGIKIIDLSQGKFQKAGVEEGFIVTRVNNKPVNSVAELKNILDNTRGGLYIEGVYTNGVIAYYAFGI